MEDLPAYDQLYEIFNPYALNRQREMRTKGTRFVHYSSAEVAVNIIKKKEVWMRKSTAMNDFMEIDHGIKCLSGAYHSEPGEQFRSILDRLHPNFSDQLKAQFDPLEPNFRYHTYLTCMSEHLESEDEIGRLSKWRAYGGTTGVALVLNSGPFLRQSNALKAYTSPVAYLSPIEFKQEFQKVVDGMEENEEMLRALDFQTLMAFVFHAFQYAVLATKHPGFKEEKEWRIIHSPWPESSQHLRRDVEVVRGIPQPVYKIPLKNIPEEGFTGATIPELLDRVIIGPTDHSFAAYEAFVSLLNEAGVENANTKVFTSHIPLRQY
jgi:hypothetical protein